MPPTFTVATWNLFHGQTSPPDRMGHFGEFAEVLAATRWDVCALQEVPQWWAVTLGERCGASVRVARGSWLRSLAPAVQQAISRRSPGRLGAAGAGVNALLVRPPAGVIAAHRSARVRRLPQRRSVHAVRLWHPEAGAWWCANVHSHNRPEQAAVADTRRALERVRSWAGDEPIVLAGDLNLHSDAAAQVASSAGFQVIGGHRVDHVLGRGMTLAAAEAGGVAARRVGAGSGSTLSDHRLVIVGIETTR